MGDHRKVSWAADLLEASVELVRQGRRASGISPRTSKLPLVEEVVGEYGHWIENYFLATVFSAAVGGLKGWFGYRTNSGGIRPLLRGGGHIYIPGVILGDEAFAQELGEYVGRLLIVLPLILHLGQLALQLFILDQRLVDRPLSEFSLLFLLLYLGLGPPPLDADAQ